MLSAVRQPLKSIWSHQLQTRWKKDGGRRLLTAAELSLAYQPHEVEQRWRGRDVKMTPNCTRGPFRMILPPPNVTGDLHLGHALMAVVQDVICRQRSQLGYQVEWVPGTDHAGIATQVVVEKQLLKQRQQTRHQVGREQFLAEIWRWRAEKGGRIADDLKKLGCSLAWDKEYFTMDKGQSSAVAEAFVRLFEEGLIERRQALVNWSCSLQSAISDIEVDSLEVDGPTELAVPGYQSNVTFGRIYEVALPLVAASGEPSGERIVVATTRPETMLGDVAVAVHPEDPRYRQYRNAAEEVLLWHPLRQQAIPLIFDLAVEPEFGSGAMKITPAHDHTDFEIAQRHLLDSVDVFDERGRVREAHGDLAGMPRFEARSAILQRLGEQGLLLGASDHRMQLPVCSRSKDIIEYMQRPQWFLRCQEMADAALSEVQSGRVQIVPPQFEAEWQRWLKDCRDWNISRQLWWGHRVPAYQASSAADPALSVWVAARSEEEARSKAAEQLGTGDLVLRQDEDVLDTWFSSALLPFSVFDWPLERYRAHYPLDLMETGHDILFFWVARMAMLGLKLTGQMPFKRILLNGIVCDAHGRKMSKSLGNVVAPQQVVQGASLESMREEVQRNHAAGLLSDVELRKSLKGLQKMFPGGIKPCGTDALRFTLCSHNIKHHFINFDVHECHTNKLFLNKIWQAMRYTLGAAEALRMPLHEIESMNAVPLGLWDRWILSRLAGTLDAVALSMDSYNLHTVAAALKQFFYAHLCDVYVETTKANMPLGGSAAYINCATLTTCLSWGLQALWPFTPHLAQELLQFVPTTIEMDLGKMRDAALERQIEEVLQVCQHIRQLKSRSNISRKHEPHVHLFASDADALELLRPHVNEIKMLTRCDGVHLALHEDLSEKSLKDEFQYYSTAGHLGSFGIRTNATVTAKAATPTHQLNEKKLQKLSDELQQYRMRWQDEGFRKSATDDVQRKHLQKMEKLEAEIKTMEALSAARHSG